jgi:hypothetical protein
VPDADLAALAAHTADQVEAFLDGVRAVASGEEPAIALAMLLLECGQLGLAGARLGALHDLVPDERFEPDPGSDPDLDELRAGLARLLGDVDGFVEVVDPIDPDRGTAGFRISDEIAAICDDLVHGLRHQRDGRVMEALWWWQFSYLASWGSSLGGLTRALHSLVAHTRLDAAAADVAGSLRRAP